MYSCTLILLLEDEEIAPFTDKAAADGVPPIRRKKKNTSAVSSTNLKVDTHLCKLRDTTPAARFRSLNTCQSPGPKSKTKNKCKHVSCGSIHLGSTLIFASCWAIQHQPLVCPTDVVRANELQQQTALMLAITHLRKLRDTPAARGFWSNFGPRSYCTLILLYTLVTHT